MELTEVHLGGQDWWTQGFEAAGPVDLLRSELQATVALVFAQALPGGVEPGTDDSMSYAQWLRQQANAKSDADALMLSLRRAEQPAVLVGWDEHAGYGCRASRLCPSVSE